MMNEIISYIEYIRCGVTHGSCLGPLLLLLHTGNFPCTVKCSKVTMYADDTSLMHSAGDDIDIVNVVNSIILHK